MNGPQRNFLDHLHPARVRLRSLHPKTTLGLGIAALTCLGILLITGLTLLLYYLPDQQRAYERILHLTTTLRFGTLLRNLHYLAGNALLILAVLHLARVALTAGYRGRRLNWCYGLLMLFLIFAGAFTGYLLPWDQLAYWALKVGSSLADYLPLLGHPLKVFLLGGEEIGAETLLRAFAIHAAVVPCGLVGLAGLHLWRVRRDGGLAAPSETPAELPARPWLYRAEGSVALITLTVLLLLALWLNAPLGERADPGHPPNPAKAPWYFVGFQEMVSYSATWGGVIIPSLMILFLALLPWLDRRERGGGRWLAPGARPWQLLLILMLCSQLVFIAIGLWCRGPNWSWVWPPGGG
ncbi:cytochrome b N-terminal domain-containing protein [Geothermobacter hydrogeniphilus]|uniref:Cytochrome b/b6 N-terminal region profile domain-containing protein n=1 Tax=Geothermobacter hydrogeniphilus TaxID=1969733 RepID=A0A1X0Y5L0_9BACT|nr:cytochrome b N-terminal domain-containing protein [Geothermobacter hydrogeniphilus]ORJ60490.1 hypothetical protein B5V00_07970 [Geothermobacter hydrogeniphilus]